MASSANPSGPRGLLSRDMTILVVCLGIAFVFWLAATLSKSYEGEIVLEVNYKNLAENEVFSTPPTQTITVRIKGTGWKLISNYMDVNVRSVAIDMAKYKQASSVSTDLLNSLISRELAAGTKVLGIDPEVISFSHDEKLSRKVPVNVPTEGLSFARGYAQSGDIQVSPDSVTISGPKSMVDTIASWSAASVNWDELQESRTEKVPLASTGGTTLELSAAEVSVTVPVEQYTEGTIEVKITPLNVPPNVSVALIPGKVNVGFQVALSQYGQVSPDLFKVGANFEGIDLTSNKKIILELMQSAPFTRNVSLSPMTVEYIIYK